MTIARPGICSSAALITSGSVESTWIGAGWLSAMRLTTSRICSSSSWRSVSATQTSSTCAPPVDLVLGDLHEAVVVVGQQQLLGLARALRVHALADERRARLLHERGGGHHRSTPAPAPRSGRCLGLAAADAVDDRARCGRASCRSSRRRSRRRSARRTPAGLFASGSGSSGKIVSPSGPWSGRPALGMQCTGSGLFSPRKRIASRMSSGPVEQLSPITSTSSATQRGEHGLDVGAEQHLAAVRQQRDARLDRQRAAGQLEGLARAEDRPP